MTGGFGFSPEHRLKTAACLSALWDGGGLRRFRAGDGVTDLPGRRLALHLMIQPDAAATFLGDAILRDQGILSPLLLASPASLAGKRKWRQPPASLDAPMRRYIAATMAALESPAPAANGAGNELTPRALDFSPDAKAAWVAFHDAIEAAMAPDGALENLRDVGSKAAENAARCAGPRYSSRCWAPPATPSPKRPGRSRCRIGLPRTSPCWRSSVARRGRSSATTCAPGSPGPASTSRWSTALMPMASHYGTAVVPARPYKPRDKAKVEVGVQVVQRWILARLRNRQFFSLAELNQAIRALVDQLNDRPMRGWGATRRALYEQVDRPALRELPPAAYEYADWKRCRVNLDYHVEIDKHFYSVPFRLLREEVEARITAKTVEIFHHGKLVAAHLRSLRPYRPTTLADHMPSSHRRYRDWTHERILREAATIGDDAAALVEIILRSRPHPEQGFRSRVTNFRLKLRTGAQRACDADGHLGPPVTSRTTTTSRTSLTRRPRNRVVTSAFRVSCLALRVSQRATLRQAVEPARELRC